MEDELNRDDRERLASIPAEIEPDPALRGRIVDSLRRERLLARSRWMTPLAVAAALIAAFIGGFLLPRSPAPAPQTREFMLFVHDTPSMRTDGNEPRRVREYGQWARELGDKLVDGEKLTDEVSGAGPRGNPSAIGGFFRVRARDRSEAEAIARSCPHVRYGGWIEVREIDRI